MRNVRSQDKYKQICEEASTSQLDENGECHFLNEK